VLTFGKGAVVDGDASGIGHASRPLRGGRASEAVDVHRGAKMAAARLMRVQKLVSVLSERV
jgi:hypothetical protein